MTLESRVLLFEPEGQPAVDSCVRDGVLHGETVLYRNARIAARLLFEGGLQNGPAVYYDEAGRVTLRSHYFQGKLHGELRFYSSDEKLLRLETYRNGLLHGKTVDYYATGAVRETRRYLENLLDGEMLQYDFGGKLIGRLCFSAGRSVPCHPMRNGAH